MENPIEKLQDEIAEKIAVATDDGFIRGVKWLSSFIILELEYQNSHEMAQKLRRFIASKEEEWRRDKINF